MHDTGVMVRCGGLIILRRIRSVWGRAGEQEGTAVESRTESWDDDVGFRVGACGERAGIAAEDVFGRRFGEGGLRV